MTAGLNIIDIIIQGLKTHLTGSEERERERERETERERDREKERVNNNNNYCRIRATEWTRI